MCLFCYSYITLVFLFSFFLLYLQYYGFRTILVTSSFLSKFSYPLGPWSSFMVWLIILVGSIRLASIRWSSCSLYFLTGHWPILICKLRLNNIPNGNWS